MQQQNQPERRKEARRSAERDAQQVMGDQARGEDDDTLQEPETVPNFLTARELQARDPVKDEERRREERRKNTLAARDGRID